MAVPSVVKIKKDGVEFTSSVDRAKYLLVELERAALRDIGKLIRKRVMQEARKQKGLKRAKRISRSYQYWVRKRENNLQVGIKHNTWYGVEQELGTSKQPKRALLTNAARNHIQDIRAIAGAYIKQIEDENRALKSIDENNEGENKDE
ncbi:HK97-gp10 family putative phage morphogenesis protein [Paenibacillus radicis (ex Xue et al. 2023)]|uniref:HK97 gp10 family phage protein n=1 Tax=Paenibacillus radicis (ex Xue et al. 2023) TaxID=2972489 RepID=A0ABT1YRE2_9BACL|nr:HK97-gp10 family putative phage morphogenesis protein [Paenibacillus radicis (ex Xue et al. 2023)]MCR8635749.1 hypothetical protein [Paenibacillus radicis (ex Xue et al. 2023)]